MKPARKGARFLLPRQKPGLFFAFFFQGGVLTSGKHFFELSRLIDDILLLAQKQRAIVGWVSLITLLPRAEEERSGIEGFAPPVLQRIRGRSGEHAQGKPHSWPGFALEPRFAVDPYRSLLPNQHPNLAACWTSFVR
jgi:hypothetical protein